MPRKSPRKGKKNAEPMLRSHNFAKFYATNVSGGPSTQDFRFHVMNEKLHYEDGWHFVSDALVILTPAAAKRLQGLLEAYVRDYERKNGPIKTDFGKDLTY